MRSWILCTKAFEKKHSQDLQVQDVPKPSAIAQARLADLPVHSYSLSPQPDSPPRIYLVCLYKTNHSLIHLSACPSVFLYVFFAAHISH